MAEEVLQFLQTLHQKRGLLGRERIHQRGDHTLVKVLVVLIRRPALVSEQDIDHAAILLTAGTAHQSLGDQLIARDGQGCQRNTDGFGDLAHTHGLFIPDLFNNVYLGDGHRAAQSACHGAFFDFIDPAEHIDQKGIELLCIFHVRAASPLVR